VPNIQTRDTTTTVGLHDGETIVIGGLIEDVDSRTIQKIPFLGDIPLLGRALFTYQNAQHTRNELIVTVTPHIVRPGESGGIGSNRLGIPRPEGLPTLPPDAQLPPPRRASEAGSPSAAPNPGRTPPAGSGAAACRRPDAGCRADVEHAAAGRCLDCKAVSVACSGWPDAVAAA
jgi:general secretion pathway protein D